MSDAISAVPGAKFSGLVEIKEMGVQGMITLRGDLSADWMVESVKETVGVDIPVQRRISSGGQGSVAWMSPDELLVLTPYADASNVAATLVRALGDNFATVAEVSDARAMFAIKGPQARDVLAKICPVDFSDFQIGEIRRTRASQVAAAIWRESEDDWRLVCFRSVGVYMFDLLKTVALPGGDVGYYS